MIHTQNQDANDLIKHLENLIGINKSIQNKNYSQVLQLRSLPKNKVQPPYHFYLN